MHKVIIIGSGCAGYPAAVYTARAGLDPLILTGERIGGWLATSNEVDNYPGFPEGIDGPELMERMRNQAKRFGADIRMDRATEVDLSSHPFKVKVGEEELETEALIVATGTSARRLGIPGEDEFWSKGVHVCATCDGPFYRDKDLVVVGGGDSAMEEAHFLSKFAKRVRILARNDEGNLKASKPLLDRSKKSDKVEIVYNTEVTEIMGEDRLAKIKLVNNRTGEEREEEIDGLFLAIGHIPNTELFEGQLDLNDNGYIKTECDSTVTGVEGVFAAGDAMDWKFRQAVTAAGFGCMAALETQRYLESKEG